MKILVTSIEFNNKGRDLFARKDGSRAISVTLNNGHIITIDLATPELVRYLTNKSAGKISDSEYKVAKLVYSACWNYLNGDEPESMDMEACSAISELAESRIDWEAAGFPKDCEDGERYITLSDHIAHYLNF